MRDGIVGKVFPNESEYFIFGFWIRNTLVHFLQNQAIQSTTIEFDIFIQIYAVWGILLFVNNTLRLFLLSNSFKWFFSSKFEFFDGSLWKKSKFRKVYFLKVTLIHPCICIYIYIYTGCFATRPTNFEGVIVDMKINIIK